MDEGVSNLAKEVQGSAGSVNGRLAGFRSKGARVVDRDGAEEARKGPVEEAVLEDVEDRHGIGRELVDEGSLELALDEVSNNETKGEPLGIGHGLVAASEDVGSGGDNGDVEEDGTKILDEEDSSPGNLGTYFRWLGFGSERETMYAYRDP